MKSDRIKIPKAPSPGEEEFAKQCRCYGFTPEREFPFHSTRKWKFDFAFPELKLAVEVEGGTRFGMSRHSRGEGIVGDCLKYNTAALMGWTVLRFTTAMVLSGQAIDTILPLLGRPE